MSVQVKICGLREPRHAALAAAHGARWIGVVFFPPSPRHVAPDRARAVLRALPPATEAVGVLVDPDDEAVRVAVATGVGALQLHGREDPERCAAIRRSAGIPIIKALGIATPEDAHRAAAFVDCADLLLFDARPPAGAARPGGNARAFDWHLLRGIDPGLPWILSGGLTAANVGTATAGTGATAVDVSSGVERAPGEKDAGRIAAFLAAARAPARGPRSAVGSSRPAGCGSSP